MVAQASPQRALGLTQGESNSYKWEVSLQADPAAIFSLTVMTLEETLAPSPFKFRSSSLIAGTILIAILAVSMEVMGWK